MLVSVVTPVYNLAHTLPQAIDSLTSQTHRDLEIIIVDDGSPDDAGDVAEQLAQGDDRIRVIHQENKGLPASLNIGFSQARGDPLLILSPDDYLHQSAIATMLAHMERMGADVVNTDMMVGGRPVETRAMNLDTLMHANCHGYAALFRRWLFKATGGFKETMGPSWEDYEFWVNCAKRGAKGARVAQPLFIYQPNPHGRGAEAQGKDRLLRGKLEGHHQDLFGAGAGVVTFVIPLYDHEEFVREAAESALAQIYPHIEVIVVDDGSPGDPLDALAGVNVNLLQQANKGLSGARNAGISASVSEFESQYAVCLDADDAVDPLFVERTMGAMGDREYVYSDLKFIGDANHDYEVKDFDCAKLFRRHLHACTFLFETSMWRDVVLRRGYGYDEAMRQGFEDWEYALACVEAGWCGLRLQEKLFRYRWHKSGSMRTEANKISGELGRYIRSKHSKERVMAGSCCGGRGRHTREPRASAVSVAGGKGMGDGIKVTYTGRKRGTMTKLGRGGQIYRFSASKPTFFADDMDLNLFQQGPYIVQRVGAPAAKPAPKPAMRQMAAQQVAHPRRPAPVAPPPPETAPRQAAPPTLSKPPGRPTPQDMAKAAAGVSRMLKDDLSKIKGVGPSTSKKMIGAGLTTYVAVSKMKPHELSIIIGTGRTRAQRIIDAAAQLVS